jgi:hypothetical protein
LLIDVVAALGAGVRLKELDRVEDVADVWTFCNAKLAGHGFPAIVKSPAAECGIIALRHCSLVWKALVRAASARFRPLLVVHDPATVKRR